jgi:hypothetical protein
MQLRIAPVTIALSSFLALMPFTAAQLLSAQTSTQASAQTASALPRLIRFGGTVKDLNDTPLTGVVGITFAFYSEQSGGAPLWLETQNATADSAGHYTVLLGSTKPEGLPAELFTSEQARWVGVQVSGQPEQPRVLLVSAPYALKAGDAETIGGLPPSAFVLAAPAVIGSSTPSATPDTVTSLAATDVTTTGGTADYLPIFSGAATIIDSSVFQTGSGTTGKIGIDTITPATQLDVNGAGTIRGTLSLPATGVATATGGKPSQGLNLTASSFSTTSSTAVNQTFRWLAEASANNTTAPSGTLNLQYGLGTAAPMETGLHIASTGKITFATGQTFPGTGTLTGITTATGSGLSGGGTTGTLSLKVPAAGITNAMLADSQITLNNNTAGGLTTPGPMTLGSTYTIGLKPCATSQILQYSGTTWNCVAPTGTGTITGVTAGADLTGGGTGGKVTLNLDTTKVPQLSAANIFTAGQTVKGSLTVGTGTPAPLGMLQVSAASSPQALGPVLTLTNSLGSGNFGGSSIDFNTYAPSTSGTYNPSSRIEAFGDGGDGDSLWFESNKDSVSAGPNQGLGLNMVIGSNGRVNIGLQDTDSNDYNEQLVANSVWQVGASEVAAVGAFGNPAYNATDSNGSDGIYAVGGDGVGNAQADFGGDGGDFYGGFTPESSSGPAGYGIFATGGVGGVGVAGFAGYFDGDINVTGTVFGSAKDFKIDHPLDPANKYLVHTSVESSEMMNIYTGNVVTDELGTATVKLPDWFEAENTDFRYQLTVIGRRAQAWIAGEVEHGQFKIASDATNTKISWQITAVRQDAFAKAHPLIVEQAKPARERGFYQNPELFGQPAEKQTEWGRRPKQMERMKEARQQQKLAARKHFTHSHDQPASAVNKPDTSHAVAAR